MRRFAALFRELDATTSRRAKVEAMARYFADAPPADAAWALYFLCGRRLQRLLPPGRLRPWATAAAGIEPWLFEECYAAVGDLAETVSLLVPAPAAEIPELPLSEWVEGRLEPLADVGEGERRAAVVGWWRGLPEEQVFLLNKMLTGALRAGVSRALAACAVARVAGLDPPLVEHRLTGSWRPSAEFFESLLSPEREGERPGRRAREVEPIRIVAVLIYAQTGRGYRASLHTDCTFGVWHGGELVPVARADSGLSDAELRELDRWIRRHTRERFGPVRAVEPVQVFELACEGIRPSKRHKSGVAVRSPRISRWRRDQPAAAADSLADVEALLPP